MASDAVDSEFEPQRVHQKNQQVTLADFFIQAEKAWYVIIA